MNFKRALIILLMAAFMMPSIVMAQFTARFLVTKTFTDSNTGEVEVTITCNTGVPLTQSAMISAGNPVAFVVDEMIVAGDSSIGETTCEIVEDGETGYDAEYNNGTADSDNSCLYTATLNNIGEGNICSITNTPGHVNVVVTKEWAFAGAGGDDVDTDITIFAMSEGHIEGGYDCYGYGVASVNGMDHWCIDLDFSGNDTETIKVMPSFGGTTVTLSESDTDSSVEIDNTCGGGSSGSVTVKPGQGAACTFTNTVFFEGIPTLSQYGLAIMALLMLGVGFVGFRRFV